MQAKGDYIVGNTKCLNAVSIAPVSAKVQEAGNKDVAGINVRGGNGVPDRSRQ
jgi:hypothetical protein